MKNLFHSIVLCSIFLTGCASKSMYKYESKEELQKLKSSIENSDNNKIAANYVERLGKRVDEEFKAPEVKFRIGSKPIQEVFYVRGSNYAVEAHSRIKMNPNGDCSLIYGGPITERHTAVFFKAAKEIINHDCKKTLVQMESLGGLVSIGMKMGLLIHKYSWETSAWREYVLQNYYISGCHSSCSLAFLAGALRYERRTLNAYDNIGPVFFHQLSKGDNKDKKCLTNPTEAPNLNVYNYLTKVRGVSGLNLYAKVLDTSCKSANESYFFEDTDKIVYTSEFTSDIIKRFVFK